MHIDLPKMSRWGDTHVAIVCECGKQQTHRTADLRRSFPATTSIDALPSVLTAYCRRINETCRAEFVSPDDGCAAEG